MAKKPIPMPVADEPGYPPFADIKQRAAENAALRSSNFEQMYAACPNCGEQILLARPEIRPTAYEPNRPVVCPSCGWRDSIAEGY